jgi:hypothetical protein
MATVYCSDPALVSQPGFYDVDDEGQIVPDALVEADSGDPNSNMTWLQAKIKVSGGLAGGEE